MKMKCILLILLIVIAAFFATRSADQTGESTAPTSTRVRSRLPSKDAPFWQSAVVNESAVFREPREIKISQPDLPPVDYPSEVARLLKTGETEALNFALAAWFDVDPIAARDWLAEQESLDAYQFALTMIVGRIAAAGDPAHALEWAALLPLGPGQEQAVFDAYAVAARDQLFTQAQLASAPLSQERIAELLSGAAGD